MQDFTGYVNEICDFLFINDKFNINYNSETDTKIPFESKFKRLTDEGQKIVIEAFDIIFNDIDNINSLSDDEKNKYFGEDMATWVISKTTEPLTAPRPT